MKTNPSPFTRAYLAAALWSSTDDAGEPMDRRYSVADLAPEALERAAADCVRFVALAADIPDSGSDNAGHDFWLTRNGHGAGFWDGDWPEADGERLTEICKTFGSVDLYVGDDGQLYFS